jgi:hypothetical protein
VTGDCACCWCVWTPTALARAEVRVFFIPPSHGARRPQTIALARGSRFPYRGLLARPARSAITSSSTFYVTTSALQALAMRFCILGALCVCCQCVYSGRPFDSQVVPCTARRWTPSHTPSQQQTNRQKSHLRRDHASRRATSSARRCHTRGPAAWVTIDCVRVSVGVVAAPASCIRMHQRRRTGSHVARYSALLLLQDSHNTHTAVQYRREVHTPRRHLRDNARRHAVITK